MCDLCIKYGTDQIVDRQELRRAFDDAAKRFFEADNDIEHLSDFVARISGVEDTTSLPSLDWEFTNDGSREES